MADAITPLRAALYLDFDNVLMALLRRDEGAAYAFGERPDVWLAWLEGMEPRRRTLIRRCYLNPGRYVDFAIGGAVARYRMERDLRNRVYFSEFRTAFVAAGFDVVDCPPVASLKNAADMKMALDIREALDHPTRFDEFILLSGDSDFLPALMRLRAYDRRVTILAQDTAKQAYLAAADLVVGLEEFARQGMGHLPVMTVPMPLRERALPAPRAPEAPRNGPDLSALRAAALDWLRRAVAESPAGALRLTVVGSAINRALPVLRHTAYAGAGTLGALIEEARDPRLLITGTAPRLWLFDPERGPPPGDLPPGEEEQPVVGEPLPLAELPGADAHAQPVAEAPLPDSGASPAPADRAPAQSTPSRAQLMAEAALLVRDILWGSRDMKGLPHDLPALAAEEIGFVLIALAARLPMEVEELPLVATEIAAEGAGRDLHVSPREVTAVVRWLLRGYAKLNEAPGADAAARLARTLYATLLNAVQAVGERLSEAEKDALRAWTTHALSHEAVEGRSSDQAVPTDAPPAG